MTNGFLLLVLLFDDTVNNITEIFWAVGTSGQKPFFDDADDTVVVVLVGNLEGVLIIGVARFNQVFHLLIHCGNCSLDVAAFQVGRKEFFVEVLVFVNNCQKLVSVSLKVAVCKDALCKFCFQFFV